MFSDNITFYDLETESTTTNRKEREICDIGACRGNATFHENSLSKFEDFIKGTKFLCGHNILRHDNLYIKNRLEKLNITHFIDTLLLSPLLDPYKPYHYLIKEDNIVGSNSFNNPLKDSQRASKLLEDFIEKYNMLNINIQRILYFLLHEQKDFKGFFEYINVRFIKFGVNLSSLIKREIENKICANAPVDRLIKDYPIELAYTIMLFSQHAEQKKEINWAEVQKEVNEDFDIIGKRALEDSKYVLKTPPWVLMTFPKIEEVVHILRGTNCKSCKYCKGELDEVKALEKYFGYTSFRSFEGKDLQYEAVKAANNDESILAIFPTAGGKSLTFQLPALISGDAENSLTVVISPLQSLMKDQVDVLDKEHGIYNAATLNGLQDPIDRNEEYGKVEKGIASLLYISPEKLRSKSIENLLLKRHIARFVIDEAHCLSSWGHDFRPDYQYIGKFIKSLQEKKGGKRIPVSCFTATAKKEVIEEIKQYFKEILDLELREISTDTRRKNLNYFQIAVNNQEEKFNVLIKLLREKQCPTIIYVSRVKRANELAEKLCARNFKAKAYNAKIDAQEKIKTQDDFKNGNVDIIVATTAFGMGVDKSDVGMVIHYDISDSLENYAQESGRAGRDQKIQADCYIIYNENDLNLHFSLLNQTKLSIKEIQDIWKVVKLLTKGNRKTFSKSPIEIARKAGWDIDGDKSKIETKVITAINSLEQSRFLERGQNEPKIFADSILVKNIMEAREKLEKSPYFKDETRKTNAVRILQSLLSAKSTTFNKEDIPESRVEYIAGNLSLKTKEVMDIVEDLKAAEILSDTQDLKINFTKEGSIKPKKQKLEKFYKIEKNFLEGLKEGENLYDLKAISASFENTSTFELEKVIGYLSITGLIKTKKAGKKYVFNISSEKGKDELLKNLESRFDIANSTLEYLNELDEHKPKDANLIEVSTKMLVDNYGQNLLGESTSPKEMQNVLFYLSRTDILKIEGNFLVFYNAIKVERIADVSRRYTKADYTKLEEFYENRKRQIHFVGEYAKLMKEDLLKAKEFERDYFNLESKEFEAKYYKGRQKELTLSITPKKYQELFSDLSQQQLKIIEDRDTQYIVVAAGPGSGKTRILTRKLASLSLLEDVKNDELLMLAFSRAAVNDFKTKMYEILKEQAKYIKIKTFHSYCFDLLGKVGNINESDVIEVATEKIKLGEVDEHMVNIKTLVIDEAQDMNNKDFGLIEALIEQNEDMRIIAVGDDDQCIYEVKKADPQLFSSFLKKDNSKKYELVDNYRSYANLVDFANQFIKNEKQRLKNQIINPVSKLFGKIQMTKVKSENIEGAAINAVLSEKNVGSTCIAAQTNEEVSMIAAMLMENGIDASKIQSLMNFKTKSYSLLEIRDFIKYITDSLEKNKANEISRELWEEAKEVNLKKYGKSQNLDVLKAFLKSFETDFPDEKYKDDVLEFAREMKLEELKDTEKNKIFVSTIHKIKGREFDNMYIVLGYKLKYKNSTERNRLIYVALTRARKNMHIFYKDDYFDHIKTLNLFKDVDNNDYKLPKEVIIKFDYSDVGLKYFDNSVMQYKISRLKSGDPLYFDDPKGKILFLSEDFQKGGRIFFSCKKDENIEIFRNKGYVMHKAKVQDIVYWKNPEKPDNPNEIKIILPEITLRLEDEQI